MSKPLVFTLKTTVNYGQALEDAIRQGAPNTSLGSCIYDVEGQFPTENVNARVKLRFVRLGPNFTSQDALNYAKAEEIDDAHLRDILSATAEHSKLADEQNEDLMFLNSPIICMVGGIEHVPYVRCFRDGIRAVGTRCLKYGFAPERREFYRRCWFVFRESVETVPGEPNDK